MSGRVYGGRGSRLLDADAGQATRAERIEVGAAEIHATPAHEWAWICDDVLVMERQSRTFAFGGRSCSDRGRGVQVLVRATS